MHMHILIEIISIIIFLYLKLKNIDYNDTHITKKRKDCIFEDTKKYVSKYVHSKQAT